MFSDKIIGGQKRLPTTLGFLQVGLDKQTSSNCKSGHWFGLDKHRLTFVLNFIITFSISSGSGGRNTNSQPAKSPVRWWQVFETPYLI
jgi:hypothetical protein